MFRKRWLVQGWKQEGYISAFFWTRTGAVVFGAQLVRQGYWPVLVGPTEVLR